MKKLLLILLCLPMIGFGQCILGDCKNGFGEYRFPNGDIYEGNWCGGLMHGEGTYKTNQKNEYVGQWKNGEYVSQWYNGKYVQPFGIKNKEIGTFSFTADNNNDTINISVPLKKPKENYFYSNNHPNANGLEFSIQIPDGYTAEEGQRANTVQVFTKENKLPITIHIYPYKDYKDDLPDFVQFSNDSDAFKSNVKNLVNELKTTNNIYYYECIGYPGYIAEGEESGITSHQLNIFLEKNLFVISIGKRNITKLERDILKECYESLELVKIHEESNSPERLYNWSVSDKNLFSNDCKNSGMETMYSEKQLDAFCNCALEEMMNKYNSLPKDIDEQWLKEKAKKCTEYILGIE